MKLKVGNPILLDRLFNCYEVSIRLVSETKVHEVSQEYHLGLLEVHSVEDVHQVLEEFLEYERKGSAVDASVCKTLENFFNTPHPTGVASVTVAYHDSCGIPYTAHALDDLGNVMDLSSIVFPGKVPQAN